MKKAGVALLIVLLLALVLRSAGGAGFWRRYWFALTDEAAGPAAGLVQPRVKLSGVAGEIPRASAEAELIAAEALVAATDEARRQRLKALIVHRHGHRVLEHFAEGRSGADEIGGGELSPALFALAAGALVDTRRVEVDAALAAIREATQPGARWRNPWSAAAARRFSLAAPPPLLLQDAEGSVAETISRRVWQPLGAADAALWGKDDSLLRADCCVAARLDDWMRVGDLFLQQGSYQGARIVSPDWIRQLLAADPDGRRHPVWLADQSEWSGDEPPATREVYWFDLGADLRLWLMPRRSLAVLVWAQGKDARDTQIPNIILRGLLDQMPSAGGETDLNQLVPGH